MLKTALILDGSKAMDSSADFVPTRILALHPLVTSFVSRYLSSTPLATLTAVVARDSLAHCVAPLSSSSEVLLDALDKRYFLVGGTGSFSLESGLRVAFSELIDLKQTRRNATLRAVLVTGSVTVLDGTDVNSFLPLLKRAGVRVDVVSLCGAVHVLSEVVAATGGVFYCPTNYQHFGEIMSLLAQPVLQKESPALHELVPVGFPQLAPVGPEKPGKCYVRCPQCHLPQTAIPTTCKLCNLLICSVPTTHASFIRRNPLLPATTRTRPADVCAKRPREESAADASAMSISTAALANCSMCDVCVVQDTEVKRCVVCEQVRCLACDLYVTESIGCCPTCVAAQ